MLKKFSHPKYRIEETLKIKGLHYVNQWYDTQKTFTIVVQGRFCGSHVLQENVQRILALVYISLLQRSTNSYQIHSQKINLCLEESFFPTGFTKWDKFLTMSGTHNFESL